MHIKRLEIKNWLGIKELQFNPGKINKISGDSGSGKSSVLESLEKLFTNKNRRTEVVRHGDSEAELFVELDDQLEVSRKIRTEKSDYLKVKHDSKAVSSTESFLKKLVNGEIFRPVEFVKKSPDEQAKIILNMLEIPWTTEDIKQWFGEVPEADYQLHILQFLKQIESGYYSERESINREVNLLRANIEGIKRDLPPNYDGEEWRGINLQSLYKSLSDAEESNKRLLEAQNLVEGLAIRIDDIKRRAENAAEEKRLDYNRQRDALTSSIKRLDENVQREQVSIDDANRRVLESATQLDSELEQAIERLKLQYQAKKQTAREEIQLASEQSRVFISEYKEQIAEKKATLSSLDEHERKDIEKINDHRETLISAENDKTGNAQQTIDTLKLIDTEPLKEAANNASEMKEYLREWERMNDIIREKITPKEERSAELTTKIKTARELPQTLLKTASLPISGLEVDEKGRIRINGTLIDGLSEGEAITFAFKLAKAQAGELKVICVDGWQNLGEEMQHSIIEEAAQDDLQYFITETVPGKEFDIQVEG
ncbi:AAA family ATPase [Paenibacillus xylanexedens]|uniref:AAA family ATPase n=1 Tax=Paenibacillus xylanexedens TaxID=528191 RepID=UPI00119CA560|nr:AAA family ATPase [Paenibacillus xylanexedens]